MSRLDGQGNHCFVCGPRNPVGLQVPFRLDGDRCRGEFVPGPDHVGWNDLTHGGILFALLDDAMANWLYLNDELGHTARCEVRYRAMAPVGTPLQVEGWPVSRRGRLVNLAGRITRCDDDTLVAECTACFMLHRNGA